MIFLYLLLPLLIPAALVALIWVCVRTIEQGKELKRLRQDLDALSGGMYGRFDFSFPTEETPETPPMPTPPPRPAPVRQTPPSPTDVPPVRQTPPVPRPAPQPPTRSTKTDSAPARTSSGTLETWLGRNVLGIVASILVFIGLIFLGVLVYGNITEPVKIALMYALSTLLTGLGVFLAVKKRNNFTLALTGCGCGSFFLSILLTHVYFGKLPDLAAFGLLLVWMACTLFVARWQRSTLMSVIAHAGMIISLCFAFTQGISDEKLWLVLLYQVTASAVMLVGNIFCCRKTYHFGTFASLGLTLVASGVMSARFAPVDKTAPFLTGLPVPAVVAAFALQFLMACVFSYLLAISASRMKDDGSKIALHLLNKLLWAAALCTNVYLVAYRLALPYFPAFSDRAPAIGIALLACLLPLLLHVALSLVMQIKLRFSKVLECISVLTCFSLTAIFLLIFWGSRMFGAEFLPRLPWLIVPAGLLFLIRRFSRQPAYLVAANVLLGMDFLFAIFGGYGRLVTFGTPAAALGWMLLYGIAIVGQWFFQTPPNRKKYSVPTRILLYLTVVLSLPVILLNTSVPYPGVTVLSVLTGLHFLLFLLRYDRENHGNTLEWLLGAVSLLLLALNAWFIAFGVRRSAVETGLYFLLTALAFFLAAVRTPRLFYYKDRPAQGALTGVVFTLLVLATVEGNTEWFSQTYLLSITCMLTALACIVAGFLGRVSSLRFYGLILTLTCVLKLVTLDVIHLRSLLRVIALIGGGIICFIVSAIYNYTVKQMKLTKEKPTDTQTEENEGNVS